MSNHAAQGIGTRSDPDRSEPSPELLRVAGWATLVAVVLLVLSGVALALFFGGAGAIFGPINDVLVAASFLLLVATVLAVREVARGRVGTSFTAATVLGVVGLVEAAAGQLLLVVGVISLQTSFVTISIGMLGFFAWGVAVVVVTLRSGILARSVAWWAVATFGILGIALAALLVLPTSVVYLLAVPLLVATVGWLVTLGRELLARASAIAPRPSG